MFSKGTKTSRHPLVMISILLAMLFLFSHVTYSPASDNADIAEVATPEKPQGSREFDPRILIIANTPGGLEQSLRNKGFTFNTMNGNIGAQTLNNYEVLITDANSVFSQQQEYVHLENWLKVPGHGWLVFHLAHGQYKGNEPLRIQGLRSFPVNDHTAGNNFNKVGNHPIHTTPNVLPNNFEPVSNYNNLNNNVDTCTTLYKSNSNNIICTSHEYNAGHVMQISGRLRYWQANNNNDNLIENAITWLAKPPHLVEPDDIAHAGAYHDGNTLFAGLKPYTFGINLTATMTVDDFSGMSFHFDQNFTNVTFTYNKTRNEFRKTADPLDSVEFLGATYADDSKERIWLNFSMGFNFTFRTTLPVDCLVNVTNVLGECSIQSYADVFRVEKDFNLVGDMQVNGSYHGPLEEDDWICGGENLTFSNMMVVYNSTSNLTPENNFFNISIIDKNGRREVKNRTSGEYFNISFQAQKESDDEHMFWASIIDRPEGCRDLKNWSISLKIDGDAPPAPVGLSLYNELMDKDISVYNNNGDFWVKWDEVGEPEGSGIKGYYISTLDRNGTTDGNFTELTSHHLTGLPEGLTTIYVWTIDKVGNIGLAANSSILVDFTNITFTNLYPSDGQWLNSTYVRCTVDIFDINGSGVNDKSVEDSISTTGPLGFGIWRKSFVSAPGERVHAFMDMTCNEGEDNYFRWRAKDRATNGFEESAAINIKIDTISPQFSETLIGRKEWFMDTSIELGIEITDEGCGVDPDSLLFSISTAGRNSFSDWMTIERENLTEIENGYSISVVANFLEGTDNYIRFCGTDKVQNPVALSQNFKLNIDVTEVEFGSERPMADEYSVYKEVEFYITISDEGSGVDASTLAYSYSTTGNKSEDFGEWIAVEDLPNGKNVRVAVSQEFEWGENNYVRWRGTDLVGNNVVVSEAYRIWLNSEPTVIVSSPLPYGGQFTTSDLIEFDASNCTDADGDELSYYWSSKIKENRSLGSSAHFFARLAPGKHKITLYVDDGNDYNVTKKIYVNVSEPGSEGNEVVSDDDDPNDPGNNGNGPDQTQGDSGTAEREGKVYDNVWFWLIVGVVSLLVALLVVLLLIRKRKKRDEKDVGPGSPESYGPPPSPYPQGYYPPVIQQGYAGGQLSSAPRSVQGGPMLPPVPYANPQPQQAQLPQYNQQQAPGSAGPSYILPSFTTHDGPQDLMRMALPPGPDSDLDERSVQALPAAGMSDPTVLDPQFPVVNQMPSLPAAMMPEPAMGFSDRPPVTPDLPAPPPSSPPPSDNRLTDLLRSLDNVTETASTPPSLGEKPLSPQGFPPPETGTPPQFPDGPAPIPPSSPPPPIQNDMIQPPVETRNVQIQCHNCQKLYIAAISQVPAVTACPGCGAGGMVDSLS